MTISFAEMFGTNSPTAIQTQPDCGNCRTTPVTASELAYVEISDEDRERLIRRAGRMMRLYMARYERSSCFADRGLADYWRMTMQADIAARSPAQVARLEAQRGLT